MALDLIRDAEGDVVGVTALEMETGDLHVLHAKTVLLATGGAGRIFQPPPTPSSTPATAWAWPPAPASRCKTWSSGSSTPPAWPVRACLLTEGCRGEGAILLNSNGERFMERYAPTLKDLAPRDFVSRCMDQEIKEGRGCGPNKDYILLKLDHLGADTIHKRLPSVYEIGVNFANVDITREPIPWCPPSTTRWAASPPTSMARWSRKQSTDNDRPVNGLYAVGECSCVSVHGANRLGTNSLLDLLVFGRAAGNHIVEFNSKQKSHKALPADAADRTLARLNRLDNATGGEYAQDVANDIRHPCSARRRVPHPGQHGRRRDQDRRMRERVNAIGLKDKSKVFNTARIEALEVENLIEAAQATMVSAAARKECRGAHTVRDYERPPTTPHTCPLGRNDANWMKHTLWYSAGNSLTYKPVQPEAADGGVVPPKVRTF
jgi:succinate dehydrogenase / fumarate reductase flavoprotein subunit